MNIKTNKGLVPFNLEHIKKSITFATNGLDNVDADKLVLEVEDSIYDGITSDSIQESSIKIASSKIKIHPNYSLVSARLMLQKLYKSIYGHSVYKNTDFYEKEYTSMYESYLEHGIEIKMIDPRLRDLFDLEQIKSAIDGKRDLLFREVGLARVIGQYLLKTNTMPQRPFELPQYWLMRVAMGLALNEKNPTEMAIKFYNKLSSLDLLNSTPTLINSGRVRNQLSSCFLVSTEDSLEGIYKTITDSAKLSKYAGGLGIDFTNVRSSGSLIKGTNGPSMGLIPFLKVQDSSTAAINQCNDPDSLIITKTGYKPIMEVKIGDYVLGFSGTFKQVEDKMDYPCDDKPMVKIRVKNSIEDYKITTGHPIFALQGIRIMETVKVTMSKLANKKKVPAWVPSGKLKVGDYVGKVIPTVIEDQDITTDDAIFYGIMLGDGYGDADEWILTGSPKKKSMTFASDYLTKKGIKYTLSNEDPNSQKIRFATSAGVKRDSDTGQIIKKIQYTLPFDSDDLHQMIEDKKVKNISSRFMHLPQEKAMGIVKGLVWTDGHVTTKDNTEITFSSSSRLLAHNLMYQLLRFGVGSSGSNTTRKFMKFKVGDNSVAKNVTSTEYIVRIPRHEIIANLLDLEPSKATNYFVHGGLLFSRVLSTEELPTSEKPSVVCDLIVNEDHNYSSSLGLQSNGGIRKGAIMVSIEPWHGDVFDFLATKYAQGDEARKTPNLHTVLWCPDLFFKRIQENGTWTLFSPSDVPDLHNLYGQAFETAYINYENNPDIPKKTIQVKELWDEVLSSLLGKGFGHPWISYKDAWNVRNPERTTGLIKSANLCQEIGIPSNSKEVGTCNLASINLSNHVIGNSVNWSKLRDSIHIGVRMLDNVIDINFYAIPETKYANQMRRPIGLGVMGMQDMFQMLNMAFESDEAKALTDKLFEFLSFEAITTSVELAKEKGSYSTFGESLWAKGVLTLDTQKEYAKERGMDINVDLSSTLDWDTLREKVKSGMRNSQVLALAPTRSISYIAGTSPSIEPWDDNIFTESGMLGKYTMVNRFLVSRLQELGLWSSDMLQLLQTTSLQKILSVPKEIRDQYKTAWEMHPKHIIAHNALRSKWVDMGISFNQWLPANNIRDAERLYLECWKAGLKSTYYLHSKGTLDTHTSEEKITAKMCSLLNPEECEACQ